MSTTTERSGVLDTLRIKLASLTWSHFLAAAVILGVLLRLIHYGLGRMLWLDEAMLTLNLVARSGTDLIAPLDFRQVAPPGWLIVTDLFVDTTKSYAYGARFPAFVAGLASLWLFYKISVSQLTKPAAFLAVVLFSLNYSAVYFSAEVKPYAFDMLLWLALAWLALSVIDKQRMNLSQITIIGGLFVLGSVFTLAAPIVVGSVGGCLLVNRYLKRDVRAMVMLGIAAFISAAIFLIVSLTIYKTQVDVSGISDGGMGDYFNRLYAPFPPLNVADLVWYPTTVEHLFSDWFGTQSTYLMIFLCVCGAIVMIQRNIWLAVLCLGAPLLALALSMAQVYPLMARLSLYMVPIAILLAAIAMQRLMQEVGGVVPVILVGAIALTSHGSVSHYLYEQTFTPHQSSRDLSGELSTFSAEASDEDVILLTRWSLPPYLLYRHAYGLQDHRWTVVDHAACLTKEDLRHLQVERIWLAKPFDKWSQLDARLEIAPKAQSDSSIMYNVEPLVEAIDWMRENDLERFPQDPLDCATPWKVEQFLRGGAAPVQWNAVSGGEGT